MPRERKLRKGQKRFCRLRGGLQFISSYKDAEGHTVTDIMHCRASNIPRYAQRLANTAQAEVTVFMYAFDRKGRYLKGHLGPLPPNGPAPKPRHDYKQWRRRYGEIRDPVFKAKVDRLIRAGFLVKLHGNGHILYDDGVGHGLRCWARQDPSNERSWLVGFSEFNEPYRGYLNGCDSILYSQYWYFDKWSCCEEFPKTGDFDAFVETLMKG